MRISQLIDSRPELIEPGVIPPRSTWRDLDPHPLVAAILYRRGMRTAEDVATFMEPAHHPTPDPYRIPNMRAAVERILLAVHRDERVGVFGDYDADGITSTAILTLALRSSLAPERVIPRLPDRAEGYGLNETAIEEFRDAGVSLVIAVDCGSTDHRSAAAIAGHGMDLVILDHHHMRDDGPPTAVTVSPQLDEDAALRDLTAAGVTWLLVAALTARGLPVTGRDPADASALLDLVALGTVADVAPLTGVNRNLVARGIERMRTEPRPGVAALIDAAGLKSSSISATNVSFALAPRINAAGRMGSPRLAFDLLTTDSPVEARRLAHELEQVNIRRRSRSAQVHAEAWEAIVKNPDWQIRPVVVVQHPGWESGLVGAVASRLVEEVRRPVLLFREEAGVLWGSARSVEGINLVETLESVESLLIRFGGHSLAAGLSLTAGNLLALESHLAATMQSAGVTVPSPRRLQVDATLPSDYLTLETVRELGRMEPFGRGNEQPVLWIKGAELQRYTDIGQDRRHLKVFARAGNRQVEAIFWGAAERSRELVACRTIDLIGRLEINAWNGQERLQMVLDEFHAS